MGKKTVPTTENVVVRTAKEIFGTRLVTNVHRSLLVEAIVAMALEPEWEWLGGYSEYDFRHQNGTALEVKQSAALQTWNIESGRKTCCQFDIAARKRHWENDTKWIESDGNRKADIYVFAHHPIITELADHRDARQWRFFVVLEKELPKQKSIALSRVERLAKSVGFLDLKSTVSKIRKTIL